MEHSNLQTIVILIYNESEIVKLCQDEEVIMYPITFQKFNAMKFARHIIQIHLGRKVFLMYNITLMKINKKSHHLHIVQHQIANQNNFNTKLAVTHHIYIFITKKANGSTSLN